MLIQAQAYQIWFTDFKMGKGHKWPTIVDPPISVGLFALMLTTYGQLNKLQNCSLFWPFLALNQPQNCSISCYIDAFLYGELAILKTLFRESSLWEHSPREYSPKQGPGHIVSQVPKVLNRVINLILGCSYAIGIDPSLMPSQIPIIHLSRFSWVYFYYMPKRRKSSKLKKKWKYHYTFIL